MPTDPDTLKRARMALAQAVTRSLEGAYPAQRAARTHRAAAVTYLRRAGREDLAVRIEPVADDTAARQTDREVMQLIDAALSPEVGFERAAADGGEP